MRRALLAATLLACSPGPAAPPGKTTPPRPPPVAETCAVTLPPRTSEGGAALPPLPGPPGPPIALRSTLVVGVELPLAGLRQQIEAKVPRRVAEERDHDLGVAGHLEYTVDRGPFALRVDGDTLVVEAPLQGQAQACAKGRCYAGCTPGARVTARIPLRAGADYKLHTSDVQVEITRGCEVRALGGILTVDVTPILRGALQGQSRMIQAAIDRELPDLRPEAQRLWSELEKPRPLPLGACVRLEPEELLQGPATGTPELAHLRFGLLARPEVRVKCGADVAPARARPLPPLRDDRALPAAGDVHLAIVLAPDAPARALEGGDPFDLGAGRAQVRKASGDPLAGLLLQLGGEVCGEVAMRASGAAWTDAQSLHLTGAAPLAEEVDRLGAGAVDGARLASAVEHAAIPLPIAVTALATLLPELASGLSDDRVTLTATVASALPETAGLRGADVVAVALLRGSVTVRAR
ncbi:MAG TPA: DUF4403 family protein [Labilithrix sp.]|nr:DUF4403 family protein [Labilithrix sp.]